MAVGRAGQGSRKQVHAVFWIGAGGKTGGLLSRQGRLAGNGSGTSGTQNTRDESDDDRKSRWGGAALSCDFGQLMP